MALSVRVWHGGASGLCIETLLTEDPKLGIIKPGGARSETQCLEKRSAQT